MTQASTPEITIRAYTPADVDILMDLFLRSVRDLASRDYTSEQINAWASQRQDRNRWLERRANRPTFIAEVGSRIAGFSDLEADGHIDMLYVHPDFQGMGIARTLITHLEQRAVANGITKLYTEASLTARPAFEHFGFTVIAEQEVPIGGQLLRNLRMSKVL